MNPTNQPTMPTDDEVFSTLYGTPTTPERQRSASSWDTQLGVVGMIVLLGGSLTIALVLGYFLATGWTVPGW